MFVRKFLGTVSLLLFISGCSEKYEDNYTFVPPKFKEDRVCANQCVTERNSCLQKCTEKGSIVDLGSKFISVFDQDQGRNNDSATTKCDNVCRDSHVVCHQNCGGKVIVEKVCVEFCKKK